MQAGVEAISSTEAAHQNAASPEKHGQTYAELLRTAPGVLYRVDPDGPAEQIGIETDGEITVEACQKSDIFSKTSHRKVSARSLQLTLFCVRFFCFVFPCFSVVFWLVDFVVS